MSDSEDDIQLYREQYASDDSSKKIAKASTSGNKKHKIDRIVSSETEDDLSNSDCDESERCAICLGRIRGKIGSPDAVGCDHYFCLLCILEWAKNNASCPQDRRHFNKIIVRKYIGGSVSEKIPVEVKKTDQLLPVVEENPTYCEVCGSCEHEDCLLLCDGCDLGYHLECLTPPLSEVPIEEWFCPLCVAADLPQVISNIAIQEENLQTEAEIAKNKRVKDEIRRRTATNRSGLRRIPRTRETERILQRITKERRKEKRRKKKRRKLKSKNSDEDKGTITQLVKKAEPYGSLGDDDIDAAFNNDDYADKLLNTSLDSKPRDRSADLTAAEIFNNRMSVPSSTYMGRASHPKVKESNNNAVPDVLNNILINQNILLAKSSEVIIDTNRSLTLKDGSKQADFSSIDQESSIMSIPLPSHTKVAPPVEDSASDRRRSSTNQRRSRSRTSPDRNYHRSHSNKYNSTSKRKEEKFYHGSFRHRSRSRDHLKDRSHHYRGHSFRDTRRHRSRSKDKKRSRFRSSRSRSKEHSRLQSPRRRNSRMTRSRSPRRRHSRSKSPKKRSSRSRSPRRRASRSPRRRMSRSPRRRTSRSRSPRRRPSPGNSISKAVRRRSSHSKSPNRHNSRSKSPKNRNKSPLPPNSMSMSPKSNRCQSPQNICSIQPIIRDAAAMDMGSKDHSWGMSRSKRMFESPSSNENKPKTKSSWSNSYYAETFVSQSNDNSQCSLHSMELPRTPVRTEPIYDIHTPSKESFSPTAPMLFKNTFTENGTSSSSTDLERNSSSNIKRLTDAFIDEKASHVSPTKIEKALNEYVLTNKFHTIFGDDNDDDDEDKNRGNGKGNESSPYDPCDTGFDSPISVVSTESPVGNKSNHDAPYDPARPGSDSPESSIKGGVGDSPYDPDTAGQDSPYDPACPGADSSPYDPDQIFDENSPLVDVDPISPVDSNDSDSDSPVFEPFSPKMDDMDFTMTDQTSDSDFVSSVSSDNDTRAKRSTTSDQVSSSLSSTTNDRSELLTAVTKSGRKRKDSKLFPAEDSSLFVDIFESPVKMSTLDSEEIIRNKLKKIDENINKDTTATNQSAYDRLFNPNKFINPVTALGNDVKKKEAGIKIKEFKDTDFDVSIVTKPQLNFDDIGLKRHSNKSDSNKKAAAAVVVAAVNLDDSKVSLTKTEKLELEAKVVKEANKYLYPYYQDKCFTKQTYKEIMEKIVRKVLERERSMSIKAEKIQRLVDGYVQLHLHKLKKKSK